MDRSSKTARQKTKTKKFLKRLAFILDRDTIKTVKKKGDKKDGYF